MESVEVPEADLAEVAEELSAKFSVVAFERKEEVLNVLKQHLPKTYRAVTKLLGENLVKFDNAIDLIDDKDGKQFLINLKSAMLESVVVWSKSSDDMKGALMRLAKVVYKVYSEYEKLSNLAKKELNSKICLPTGLRVVAVSHESQESVLDIKEFLEQMVDIGRDLKKLGL